jgi:hypothetical protein
VPEEQVVHLPELPLGPRRLRGLGGELRSGVLRSTGVVALRVDRGREVDELVRRAEDAAELRALADAQKLREVA